MLDATRSVLQELRTDARYKALLEDLRELRPTIPAFDHHADNTDEWKASSLMRRGFDIGFVFIMGIDP